MSEPDRNDSGHAGRPHLRKQGSATQLIVDGEPFLILGGELHNSSSSSIEYMKPIWESMLAMGFNTVLAPVYWELLEPEEGCFDFALVDGLIQDARRHGLRLVLLWFGSWKNGMSSYPPLWVKRDFERFPRVMIGEGNTIEVLSPLADESARADAAAYRALMAHIRVVDGDDHTVIMMQVQNEVGVLGDSRDRSAAAEKAFAAPVPQELIDYLLENKEDLVVEIREAWEATGFTTSGSWQQVFGAGVETDGFFMAWNYARYVDTVTSAGRAEYDIPMYTNAWLGRPPQKPGDYPSGGPLPQVLDFWIAGAPGIDLLAPDIYADAFAKWCEGFTRRGNPLFIPEMRSAGAGPRNVFYAIGQHDAIGVSPFAVDSMQQPGESDLAKSYHVLRQIAPMILAHQGKGEMVAVLLDEDHPQTTRELGGYQLEISLDSVFGYTAKLGFGLIISVGPDTFIGAGAGFRVAFHPKMARPGLEGPALAGIGMVDEGVYREGKWVPGRRLNGDENDQGRRWRFGQDKIRIERCVVYRYQ